MATTDFMNPTAAKIVLAAQHGDSINRISNKIGTSYSWVYDWIGRLDDAEIILNTDNGVRVLDYEMRRRYEEMMGTLYSRDDVSQEDAYVIPHFAGMEFAYTEIDAAYVWTNGGFQIARSHDDYPVFIEVHERDVDRWIEFFEQFGVDTTVGERPDAADVDGSVHYVLFPQEESIDVEWVDGNPVIPLDATVSQMVETRPAYEPALEMLADEHDVDIDASHRDEIAN
ncbi:helix-turn-helix domain containing protein [Halobaculum sp. CBA1158]|uniref:helix-turn-helix domain-containing protein n=1 Tax=Halobaculum sp. CBA1158 TaxID=2904243 RepID=UPI001F3B3552|nr:helix-turn-helix domain-containing protein [Halobaculum sp. CBA1158]UIO99919.1 helix-turn-helix domain containing protein [Halobaculum sp. CBA1158]